MTLPAANLRNETKEFEQAQSQSDHVDEGFADANDDVAEHQRHVRRLPTGRQHLPPSRRAQRAVLDTHRSSLPKNVTALTMTNGCSRNLNQQANMRLALTGRKYRTTRSSSWGAWMKDRGGTWS